MEALFDALLPLPDSVRLVVGTQKIAREHLPTRLLNALPAERWTELPLMSQAAVHRWLRSQDKAGRLNLEVTAGQKRGQVVRAIARAFYDISQGLPLHLIYSFETVARTGNAMTAEDVAALPACPGGDIRDYYRSFWERMGATSRTVLHVLAGIEFGPPPFAMYDCFGRSNESLAALAEINHLLDYQETEVRPFHGSLFAFVRDLPEHEGTFHTHGSDVLAWLESCAPEYWRWAWLWITRAQLGDPSDLLGGPSRAWAVSSLLDGFPLQQLIAILDHAENAASDTFDLPRLLALRLLKTRAISGPEFQTNEWPLFQEIALSLSTDPHVRSLSRAALHRAPADLLPFIVRSADESTRAEVALNAIAELNRRIARRRDNETTADRQGELAHAVAAVVANGGPASSQRILAYAKRAANAPDALIATYVHESLLACNLDNVFAASRQCSGPHIDRELLATLCLEGLDPAAKPELRGLAHPAIRCLAILRGGIPRRSRTKRDLSHLFPAGEPVDAGYGEDTQELAYEAFFSALAAGLARGKAQGWSKIPAHAQTTWLSDAIRSLERLAERIAEGWREARRWPTLREIYGALRLRQPTSRSHDVRRCFIAIRLGLRDIAIDLCTISRGLDPNALIQREDIASAAESPFWLDELWLDSFIERRLPLHSAEAAQAFVQRVGHHLDTTITEFNERTAASAKLGMFALDNDLPSLAQKELRRGLGCLLGYGWHKDLFALDVVESLQLLAKGGDADAGQTLLDLAGEFEAITSYTDADETDFPRERYYKVVAALFPERIPACFAHLIRSEDWRYAEVLSISMLKTSQAESRIGQALFESYIGPSEVLALESASQLNTRTKGALATVLRKTGRATNPRSTSPVENLNSDDEPSEAEVSVPDASKFPPGMLHEYIAATREVRPYSHGRKLVTEWLRYWEGAGHVEELLGDLEAVTSQPKLYLHIDDALDVAFHIALKTQGRSKAFPWLIRAHIARSGWQRWWSAEHEAQARFRAVALHYRDRWREFIKATAIPAFSTQTEGNGIVIGLSRLVYFLAEVGQSDLARACALEMARVFKEETAEQPIEAPEWSK